MNDLYEAVLCNLCQKKYENSNLFSDLSSQASEYVMGYWKYVGCLMDHDTAKWQRLCKSDPENLEYQMAAIKARARVDGPKVLLDPLVDHQFWAEVASWRRRLTLETVTQLLGQSFEYVGLTCYECADQSHQIARFRHRKSDMVFHLIPGGRFLMGSKDFQQEEPVHSVTIQPYFLGRYPVSQSEWDHIGGEDARCFSGGDLPIHAISWFDAKDWLASSGVGFRLPSEAEWEYACRAGTTTDFFWGESCLSDSLQWFKDFSYAWFSRNSDAQSHPRAHHEDKANAFGLIDMTGNVLEWCADCWFDEYEDGPHDHRARSLSMDAPKVLRGGSWSAGGADLRSANRGRCDPAEKRREAGLRVAFDLPGWPADSS